MRRCLQLIWQAAVKVKFPLTGLVLYEEDPIAVPFCKSIGVKRNGVLLVS